VTMNAALKPFAVHVRYPGADALARRPQHLRSRRTPTRPTHRRGPPGPALRQRALYPAVHPPTRPRQVRQDRPLHRRPLLLRAVREGPI
jgi:hypothetical protein